MEGSEKVDNDVAQKFWYEQAQRVARKVGKTDSVGRLRTYGGTISIL